MTRVLIFGTGSIGSVYAYILDRAGCSVICICRSNYDVVATNGFTINSAIFGQNLTVRPHVVKSVEDAATYAQEQGQDFDYIIVSSKAFPNATPSTASVIAPAVGKSTAILLIQNGIAIEEEYATAFPANSIISAVTYVPATQTAPGLVTMGALDGLEIGTYPAEPLDSAMPAVTALKRLAELVAAGGATVTCYPDVQVRRWRKMIVNATWNPTCALAHQSDVQFMDASPQSIEFIWDAMLEVVAVAQALGYVDVTVKDAEQQLDRAKGRIGTKGIEFSMLADVKGERPMEVEAIVGNAVRLAKEKSVSTPYLSALYVLSKGLDTGIMHRAANI
ncbi:uncharacterized protein K452DRAFT_289493 [Aplosporella prunicola CBS 121167]|uniref:2-dehydropantoate 2-reductase n=1 Tax=Aplosporella prunicola CBS 121167 TaxID=1176127 RepID=A0A6A6B7J8_9PEZI|nr:uncharacterized protein K452DRAFT_289493 [Aplosporella prunicola CBS 121167]KAF2140099.1 hypothetical protein K452DRAFT_289493 [Aplosporella prunicola CBS 121167]